MNFLAKFSRDEFFNRRAGAVDWRPLQCPVCVAEARIPVSQMDLKTLSSFISETWIDCEPIEDIHHNIRHFIITCGKHKFNDDLRIIIEDGVLTITSASRIGLYDFGVNQKRIDTIVDFTN